MYKIVTSKNRFAQIYLNNKKFFRSNAKIIDTGDNVIFLKSEKIVAVVYNPEDLGKISLEGALNADLELVEDNY